jgi:hypothetical protein
VITAIGLAEIGFEIALGLIISYSMWMLANEVTE